MIFEELAPAKVNLFLHVGRPADDGYHPLATLMVFADIGDRVRLDTGGSGFAIEGPFADGLDADAGNLVVRARDMFLEQFGGADRPIGLALTKTLPIAAGLGGGSADAAATLRLLARAWDIQPPHDSDEGALGVIARRLGADVAACLRGASVMATGRGDVLASAPAFPPFHAVLANPLMPSATGAVYRAFDEENVWGDLAIAPPPEPGDDPAMFIDWLNSHRNDLEAPAMRLQPAITEVLMALTASPESKLVRMSGSGATCFAICGDERAAQALATRLSAQFPGWWVAQCRLGT